MQIHVAINDALMNEVLAVTNFETKEDAESMERMLISELNPAYNVDIGGRRARPRPGYKKLGRLS